MSTLSSARATGRRHVPTAAPATAPTKGWIARMQERRRARQQRRRLMRAVRAFTG